MNFSDFTARYSMMSDDEVLHIACDSNDLRPEARLALNAELQKRRLAQEDIEAYRQHLGTTGPPEVLKPIAMSFNGIGTSIYGKRDFAPDGSYLTTKWLILFGIPIVPLKSVRVLKIRGGYRILYSGAPKVKQILFVYSFVAALVLALAAQLYVPAPTAYVAFTCVCAIPWLLRRAPRQRARKAVTSGPISKNAKSLV